MAHNINEDNSTMHASNPWPSETNKCKNGSTTSFSPVVAFNAFQTCCVAPALEGLASPCPPDCGHSWGGGGNMSALTGRTRACTGGANTFTGGIVHSMGV